MSNKLIDITIIFILFAICLSIFMPLRGNNNIVSDGYQNLLLSSNIANKNVFSASPDGLPDMIREPAWPFLISILIKASDLNSLPIDALAITHKNFFKNIDVFICSLIVLSTYLFVLKALHSYVFAFLSVCITLAVIKSTPFLIMFFNSEALATLILQLSSITYLYLFKKKTLPLAILCGVGFGILVLTKAQFIYILLAPLLILAFMNKKVFLFTFFAFALIISPWLLRNYHYFDNFAIAKRGAIVASVRYMLTVGPTVDEYYCMAYAFTSPYLRPLIDKYTTLRVADFQQYGRCERLNREICYDMGEVVIPCARFGVDVAAAVPWTDRIQYFYQGFAAGLEIGRGKLSFSDFMVINSSTITKYAKTYPLFLLRGVGFSGYPVLIILMTICMFATLFTPLWPLPILALSSHLFHVSLTHNIPRYHIFEIPIMTFCFVYCLKLILDHCLFLFDKSGCK